MPLWTPPPFGKSRQTNLTAAARQGTTVTASGTVHTKGAYIDLVNPVSEDSYGLTVVASGLATAATSTSCLLDIAVGASGSEAIIIPDLDVGYSGFLNSTVSGPEAWFFPVFIPSGSVLRARCQARVVSETVSVAVFLGQEGNYPVNPGKVKVYGINAAASSGTSIVPGSGVFGSWTQIGSANGTVRGRYWTVGYDALADTTIVVTSVLVEIGFGPNSTSVDVVGSFLFGQSSSEAIYGPWPPVPIARDVPAGETLWARVASGETEARGVCIYGIS